MDRISREQMIAAATKLMSRRGTCLRAQVGAVIELDGRIISCGYNGSPPGERHCLEAGCLMEGGHCIRTTHAEANAIAWAARRGIATEGATIHVYGWITGGDLGICPACDKLARSAGIRETVIIPIDPNFKVEVKRIEFGPVVHGMTPEDLYKTVCGMEFDMGEAEAIIHTVRNNIKVRL